MKQSGECPKGGSTNIIADAMVIDRSHGGVEMTAATTEEDK
jgi:hypothetical protein